MNPSLILLNSRDQLGLEFAECNNYARSIIHHTGTSTTMY